MARFGTAVNTDPSNDVPLDALQDSDGLTPEERFELQYPDLWADGCRPVVSNDNAGDAFRAKMDRLWPGSAQDEPEPDQASDAQGGGEAPMGGAQEGDDASHSGAFGPMPDPRETMTPDGQRTWHLELALYYVRHGVKIMPLTCDEATPLFAGCYERLIETEDAARDFWMEYTWCLIGIPMGANNLAVIDSDSKNGTKPGVVERDRYFAKHGGIPETPQTITGTGGLHTFFKSVDGVRFKNSVGSFLPSNDVRAERGYVVAQGVVRSDGRRYEVAPGTIPLVEAFARGLIADMPQHLIDDLPKHDSKYDDAVHDDSEQPAPAMDDGRSSCGPRERAAAAKALDEEISKLRKATKGGRNDQLNKAAFALGQLVGAGWLDESEARTQLQWGCRDNGSWRDERDKCERSINSGLSKGTLQPRKPLKDREGYGAKGAEEARPWDAKACEEGPLDAEDVEEDAGGPERLSAAWWRQLKLPPRDYLLGDVICTTSRWHLVGETGVGKTLFGLDMAAAIAAGVEFIGWEGRRRCRVMYLDGEMPAETFQERMIVVTDRYGKDIELFGYSRDVLGQDAMPPLNTDKGMVWLWEEIQKIKPDIIFFDSVMCLLEGNMSEEDSWNPIKPYIRFLTSQRIAQVWIDHTGHDATRAYGTKTKQWEMDTVAMLSKLKGEEFDDSAAAMQFEFAKKRLCTPSNYKQFQPKIITGGEDGLVHQDGQGVAGGKKVSQLDVIKRQIVVVYDRLALDVEWSAGHAGEDVKKVAIDDIRERLKSTGYLDTNDKAQITSSDRQQFRKAKMALLMHGGFTEKDGMFWRFKNV